MIHQSMTHGEPRHISGVAPFLIHIPCSKYSPESEKQWPIWANIGYLLISFSHSEMISGKGDRAGGSGEPLRWYLTVRSLVSQTPVRTSMSSINKSKNQPAEQTNPLSQFHPPHNDRNIFKEWMIHRVSLWMTRMVLKSHTHILDCIKLFMIHEWLYRPSCLWGTASN